MFAEKPSVELTRDVRAVVVPDGTQVTLTQGTRATIQQSLGGTHTVMTDLGFMARIDGADADALGLEVEEPDAKEIPTDAESVEKSVWDVLRTCYDPEIPVNIVELGLVYECRVDRRDDDLYEVYVRMTLTAPGCGMGPVLQADVETKVRKLAGVDKAVVEVVFDPPWAREMMSEAAKLQLGMF